MVRIFSEYVIVDNHKVLCDGKICGKGKPIGGSYLCPHRNLRTKFPELIKSEWDYKNNNKKPEEYLPNSHIIVWWKCKNDPCGCHEWQACISDRTYRGSDCPFCKGKACSHNNLATHFPELIKEWDYEKNSMKPEEYSYGSGKRVYWKCKENSAHGWKTQISQRTNPKESTGCPFCFFARRISGYSKKAIDWIESIEKIENIEIKHINPEKGISEYFIPGAGKVDGYHEETNTVYEFHGDFWHGNPNIFDPEDINTFNGKTFDQLYRETLDRDNEIMKLGYTLIVKWETDIDTIEDDEFSSLHIPFPSA